MAKATKRLSRTHVSSKSEACQVAAIARRLRKEFADSPIAATACRNALAEHVAPIVSRIVGPSIGARPIAPEDLAVLAVIALTDGDIDGRARNAALLELAKAGGVDRRSL